MREIIMGNRSISSTEERIRQGITTKASLGQKGMSAASDIDNDTSHYAFTRVRTPDQIAKWSGNDDFIFDFRLVADTDTVVFDGDSIGWSGFADATASAKHRRRDIAGIKKTTRSVGHGDPEVLIKGRIPLERYLVRVNAHGDADRRAIIQMFHDAGITKIRGKNVEDIVVNVY
jgi:hypothetical protein